MKHPIVVSVLISLLAASPFVFAEKIYKWVDSEGNVHYGSQPGSSQAQELKNVRSAPTPSAPAAPPAASSQPSFMESFEKEQQEKAEATAKAEKEKEIRDKNCSVARKRLAGYEQGGRIYEIDEKGERTYLGDAEIEARLKQAKDDVAKWCQ